MKNETKAKRRVLGAHRGPSDEEVLAAGDALARQNGERSPLTETVRGGAYKSSDRPDAHWVDANGEPIEGPDAA